MNKFVIPAVLLLSSVALPGVASAEPFNGPYIGAQVGLSHDKVGTIDSELGDLRINRSKDSFVGGIYGGYDRKVTPFVVLGVEAGFSVTSSDTIKRSSGTTLSRINPMHAFDLSARAGYLVTDATLLYVRGGYQNVRAKTTFETGTVALRDKETFDGWLIGAGVERSVADAVTARLEYRYSDLSGGDGKFDRHQALIGVAYRF